MNSKDFDNLVISRISPTKKRTSFAGSKSMPSTLSFDAVKQVFGEVTVSHNSDDQILLSLKRGKLDASRVASLLTDSNEMDFLFDPEMVVGFSPDESLIQKSVNPLWVVKPQSAGVVRIQRIV